MGPFPSLFLWNLTALASVLLLMLQSAGSFSVPASVKGAMKGASGYKNERAKAKLRDVQRKDGGRVASAEWTDGGKGDVLLSYTASSEKGLSPERLAEVEATLEDGAVLSCRSHWGVISLQGEDHLRFLHSQSTNAFEGAQPGSLVPCSFLSAQGRMDENSDLCLGLVEEDKVMLLCSPHRTKARLTQFEKFLFKLDKVEVENASAQFAVFSIMGSGAAEALTDLPVFQQGATLPESGLFSSWLYDKEGYPKVGVAHVCASTGLRLPGYTVFAPVEIASRLWRELSERCGGQVVGEEEWQLLRVKQGRPWPGKEMTKDYNPLDAGLWHSVHFDKGCYMGQEAVSKVNGLDAFKYQLYGVSFPPGSEVEEGDVLRAEESTDPRPAGTVCTLQPWSSPSSPLYSPSAPVEGLAYIRRRAGGVGLTVACEASGDSGKVVDVAYPGRSDKDSAAPPSLQDKNKQVNKAREEMKAEGGKEREAARKQAKLEEVRGKMAAMKKAKLVQAMKNKRGLNL